MGSPGPSPEITPGDALGVFADLDEPSTPLTATEVADELNCTRRTAHRKLETLTERGSLETKKPGAHSRIWWRPDSGSAAGEGSRDGDYDEFADFVSAVEDYAIFTLEPDGTVASWNEGARRIKGYEESDIVGRHFSQFYTDEDVEAGVPAANLASAKADGRVEDEGWRVRADGTQFWANVVITAVRDDDGELQGFTKVTQDTTERREYEQRLQCERQRTEEILATAPIPIAVQDGDGETVMANDRAQATLGLSEEELIEGTRREEEWTLYDGDGVELDPEETPTARVLATGEPVSDAEIAIEDSSGERTWFSVNAAPFTDPHGGEDRVVVAGEDVTALKEREQELESELAEVMGRVSDAFYALDEEWQFTLVNDHAEVLLDHAEEDLIGERLWDAFPETKEDEEIHEAFRGAMETNEQRDLEVYSSPLGFWVEVHIYPSETGLSVYFRDVTERKEREQELAKYETIVETMNDGIYVKDEVGYFTMVNEAYAEMTGYDPDELVGEHASIVVDEDAMAESRQVLEDESTGPTVEAVLETADGDHVPAEGTFATLDTGQEVGVVRDITRRKERERKLRRYQRIVENVPVGVYRNTPGPDGEFVEANKAVADIFDADSVEEIMEYNISDLYTDPEQRAAFSERLEDEEVVRNVELEQETLDGRIIWISITAIKTEEDGETYFDGIVQDVTERREYEQELKQYEVLFKESRDVSGILEPDGTFRDLTPPAASVLGYEPEELVGENAFDYVHPDDRERVFEEYGRLAEDPDAEPTVEYRFERGDGDWIYLESRGRNLLEDPDVGDIVVYSRDVTERKEREQRLAERERQLSTLMDNVPGMVYRCSNDRGWPMEFVSEGFREMTGYHPEVLERNELSYGGDVVHEDDREDLWENVQRGLEEDGSFSVGYRIRAADDEVRWVRERGRGIRDDEGSLESLEGVIIDVTERRKAEQQLEQERDMFAEGPAVTFRWVPDAEAGWPVEYVSENVEDVLGYTPEELESGDVPYVDLLLDSELERIAREVEEATKSGAERFTHEPYRIKTKDGDVRWVQDSTKILRDEHGDVERYMGYLVDITESKERELELARYETIIETVNDGIYVVDEDGRFQMVNEAYADMVGYDREELLGESVSLVVDDEVSHEAKKVEAKMRDDAVDNPVVEAELKTASGDRVPSEATFALLPSAGEENHRIGVARDITERKEYERELERALDLLERTERIADVGGWEIDAETTDVFWTDHTFELLDVEGNEEPPLDEALEMYHDDDKAVIEGAVENAIECGDSFDVEVRVETGTGDTRWLRLQGSPETEDGDVVSVRGAAQDVTKRFERERELERTLDLLERTERIADVGGWELDPVTMDVFWSDHLFDILGVDGDEEPPLDEALDVYYEDDRPVVEGAIENALDTGENFDVEVRFERSGDEIRWLRVQGAPDTDGGDVVSLRGAAQDVTERIEREQQLEELVDQLEESNERLERFAYVASHDLQEPLRMVSNYLQLLERRYRDELDSDAGEFIDFAVDGAERMREMISDLLAYSRLHSEAAPMEETDPETVVENVLEDLHLRIEETDADVTVGDLPTVEADGNQLEMVFQNLVSNAIKYRGDEPPKIDIDAERRDDEWLFHVEDDGIGLDPDHADDIFEVFNRLHTTEEYPGTGIGLAMCKKIVRRHGGDIWVESEPGEGATFTFSLPDDGPDEGDLPEPGLSKPLDTEVDQ